MDAARSDETAQVVARLRRQIEQLEAQPRQLVLTLRTGLPELDAWGVFRLGGGVELNGEAASGRTSLALTVVASACRERRLAAWVDGPSELYPPAALAMGVELERLLIVRPKAPAQVVWSAVQLLRSGAFACVVLDVTHTGVRLSMTDTKKLLDAARAGGSLAVVLTGKGAPGQGLVRLTLHTQLEEGPRLSVVQAAPPSLPDEVEPPFAVEAPHGRHLVVTRPQLSRQPPLRARRRSHPDAPPWVPRVAPARSLQRPKKNFLRDGRGLLTTTTRLPVAFRGRRG